MKKVRFGSDDWLEALRQELDQLIARAGEAVKGERVSICETVTDIPPDLRASPRESSRSWHIVIEDGRGLVGLGEMPDCDYWSVCDYDAILRLARWVYSDDPEDQAAVAAHREELVRANKFRSGGAIPPSPVLGPLLRELHNNLARMTE